MRIFIVLLALAISSQVFGSVADNSVTTQKIVNNAVTLPKLYPRPMTTASPAPVGSVAVSASTGSFSSTNTGGAIAASVTITTSGRPVELIMTQDGTTGNESGFICSTNISAGVSFSCAGFFGRNGTPITSQGYLGVALHGVSITSGSSSSIISNANPIYIDTPAAGTYTYSFYAIGSSTAPLGVLFMQLVAFEL